MTAIATTCIWCALQVSLFVAVVSLLYLLLRRWSLAAGGLIAAVSLAVVILISGLAFSPWPRWELATAGENSPEPQTTIPIAESEQAVTPETVAAAPTVTPNPPETPQAGIAAWLTGFGDALTHELTVPANDHVTHAWTWTEIAVAACLALSAFGCVRLLAGLWAVRTLRNAGRPIEDDELRESADLLRAELGCSRRVELLEADQLAAPATVGWRQPVILLPAGWRSWTPLERRAVLAHEIAHIRRGDFLTYVVAQFSLVLHFYNPLVHWLAGRLRLEQELAADASAAALAGGRLEYLQMLAAMALRQTDQSVSWPARTFLPTRGHLIRRVEMLKHSKRLSTSLPGAARVVVVGLLAAVGIGVVGLRNPQGPVAKAADDPRVAQQESVKRPVATKSRIISDKFELSYVPVDAIRIIGIRPAALFEHQELVALAKKCNEDLGFQKIAGMPVEEIEQITAVASNPDGVASAGSAGTPPQPQMAFGTTMIRAVHPTNFRTLTDSFAPNAKEEEYAGQVYYKSALSRICYFRPDDRTIVVDGEANLKWVIDSGREVKAKYVQSAIWEEVADNHIFGAIDSAILSQQLDAPPPARGILPAFAPLWEGSELLLIGSKFDGGFAVEGIAGCDDDGAAKTVQETLNASVTLLKNLMTNVPSEWNKNVVDAGVAYLNGAQIMRAKNIVRISSSATVAAELMTSVIIPTMSVQRVQAHQVTERKNLKQIALAMHNYHDANGHFPPAVVLGPDSKTPHSWRVALLPYLDLRVAGELYQGYHLDEPWDSEHNKQLIEKMPTVYKRGDDSTNAAYFVFTGPGTPFGKKEGVRISDIVDGTSNTLMIVEAKRDFPWTKPEDIPYDPGAPFPEIGGYNANEFLAAKFDGSVNVIRTQGISKKIWRQAILYNDMESPDRGFYEMIRGKAKP